MPLQLGGVETTRPQTITWDPSCPKQTEESERRYAALAAQGYRLRRPHPAGEMTLDPPPRGPDIGVFRVLSPAGDERYTWDRTNPDEVRDAFAKASEARLRGEHVGRVAINPTTLDLGTHRQEIRAAAGAGR